MINVALAALVAAASPAVPVSAQKAASARSPQLAYIPTQAPAGYRYLRWRWNENAAVLHLWFRNSRGGEIAYTSTWQYGRCAKTTAHRAERCVAATSTGVRIQLTAASPQLSSAALTRVVASAKLVHFR
jgi:hypothetical protein